MIAIFFFINIVTQILTVAILVRVVLNWFPIGPNNPFYAIVYQITEPVLGPIRRVVPRVGMLDFTPMVAIILLAVIQALVQALVEAT